MKRITVLTALAGILSLAVQIMAEEKPERSGAPSAGDRPLLRSPSPPATVFDNGSDDEPAIAEAATAQTADQKPAADTAPPAANPPAPPQPAAAQPAPAQPHAAPIDAEKRIEQLKADLAAAQKEIADLRKSVSELSQAVTQTDQNLRDILHQVAEQEGGAWKLKINSLSDKDGKPRQEVVRITQGRLLIDNSGKERVIYVNGTPWKAIAGKSYIWVPVGACSISTEGGVEPTVYEKEWKRNSESGVFEMKFTF